MAGHLQADEAQISTFVHAIFKHATPGTFISLRAFDQTDRGEPPLFIRGIAINGDLGKVAKEAASLATRAG